MKVRLVSHDPSWAVLAAKEIAVLTAAIGPCVTVIHHFGSTAIPGIAAKPILDLMPVVTSHVELERRRGAIEALGYLWRGEYGLPGRRYCTKSDPADGTRLVHFHCYEEGHQDISRSLAFRDYLRTYPVIAAAYEAEKVRCQRLHAHDSHAYTDCKSAWIKKIEADALHWYAGRR